MRIRAAAVVSTLVSAVHAATFLPAGVTIGTIAPAGDESVYVAGQRGDSAFLARLNVASGDLAEIRVEVPARSNLEAIAVDRAGQVHVAGTRFSNGQPHAFVQKYDGQGRLVYSTPIGDVTYARSIAVNSTGEVVINGQVIGAGFESTPGTPGINETNTGFLVKLDVQGGVMFVVRLPLTVAAQL
jgi:hypothetical protein